MKSWLIGKDPDAGKDWRQEEKGTTEDEMVGWYHWLVGQEFKQTPGVGDGQGGCNPWGRKEMGHDWATELNWWHKLYFLVSTAWVHTHKDVKTPYTCTSRYTRGTTWSRTTCSCAESLQLCHSLDCSLPGSSVHGIFSKNTEGDCWPSPGYLPDPGMEPVSSVSSVLQADSLLLSHQGSPQNYPTQHLKICVQFSLSH